MIIPKPEHSKKRALIVHKILNDQNWKRNVEDVRSILETRNIPLSGFPKDAVGRAGVKLYRWLTDMRRAYYDEGCLQISDEQKAILCELGIEQLRPFNESKWMAHFDEFYRYYLEHPDTESWDAPRFQDGTGMTAWLNAQKQRYKHGKMKPRYEAKFRDAGILGILQSQHENALCHAEKFYEKFGSLDVPQDYVCEDGFRLGQWIRTLRDPSCNHVLPQSIIDRLNAMGMVWDVTTYNWQKMFAVCRDYYAEHGTWENVRSRQIYAWLTRNLRKYADGELTDEQILMLGSIHAFDKCPETQAQRWERHFLDCKAFIEKNGRRLRKTEGELHQWIMHNQRRFNKGKLKQEQIDKLKSIGLLQSADKRLEAADDTQKEDNNT